MKITTKELSVFLKNLCNQDFYFESIERTQEGTIKRFFEETVLVAQDLPEDEKNYYFILGIVNIGADFSSYFSIETQLKCLKKIEIDTCDSCLYKHNEDTVLNISFSSILPIINERMSEESKKEWIRSAISPDNSHFISFFKTNPEWLQYYHSELSADATLSVLSYKKRFFKDILLKKDDSNLSLFLKKQVSINKLEILKSNNIAQIGNAVLISPEIFSEEEKYNALYAIIERTNNIKNPNEMKKNSDPQISEFVQRGMANDLFYFFNTLSWRKSWSRLSKEHKGMYMNKYEFRIDKNDENGLISFIEFVGYLRKIGFNLPEQKETLFKDTKIFKTKRELFKDLNLEQNASEKEIITAISNKFNTQTHKVTRYYNDIIMHSAKIKMLSDFPHLVRIRLGSIIFRTKDFLPLFIDYVLFSDEHLEITDEDYNLLLLNHKY